MGDMECRKSSVPFLFGGDQVLSLTFPLFAFVKLVKCRNVKDRTYVLLKKPPVVSCTVTLHSKLLRPVADPRGCPRGPNFSFIS